MMPVGGRVMLGDHASHRLIQLDPEGALINSKAPSLPLAPCRIVENGFCLPASFHGTLRTIRLLFSEAALPDKWVYRFMSAQSLGAVGNLPSTI